MNSVLRVVVVHLVVLLLVSCSQRTTSEITPSGRVVKVGVMGPMKGEKAALGVSGLEGIKTALALHPLLGNGDKIEVVVEDDQGTPTGAVRAFTRLVRQGVTAVLMLSSSPCALAVNSIADRYKTPVIAILATHPKIAQGTGFVSQLCFDNQFQGKVAALFVRDELLMSSAAVFEDVGNPYSTSLAREFVKEFEAIDGAITEVVSLKGNQREMKKVLEDVKLSDPELLYLPIATSEVLTIIRLTREMNWHPQFMSGDGLLADVLSNSTKYDSALLDGVMAIDFYSDTITPTKFGRKIKRRFRSLYHKRITSFSALGVEAMIVLQDAMNGCEDPRNRECVSRRIRHIKNVEGVIGFITILPNGKAQRPLVVNKIESGKIKGMVEVY